MLLRNKLAIIILLVILFFGIITALSVYTYSRLILISHEKDSLMALTQSQAKQVESELKLGLKVTQNIALQKNVISYLKGEETDTAVVLQGLDELNIGNQFSAIYILNPQGTALISTDPAFIGKDYSFRAYFTNAIKGNNWIDAAYGITSKQLGYYFSSPVLNENNNIIGVSVVKMIPDVINISMSTSESKNNSYAMIADNYGVIVYSDRENRLYKTLAQITDSQKMLIEKMKSYPPVNPSFISYDPVYQEIISGKTRNKMIEFYDTSDKEEEIIAISQVGNFPLYLVVEKATKNVVSGVLTIAQILGLLIFVSALFAAFTIIVFLRKLLYPLNKLKEIAEKVANGDLNTDYNLKGKVGHDEIGTLITSFNTMVTKLRDSTRNIENKVKERTEELEKFQLAVENASDHIVITDPEGIILYANQAVKRITGFSNSEIIGKKAGSKDLWGGQMNKSFYDDFWKIIKNDKKTFTGELKNKRKNGEIYDSAVNVSPVVDKKDGKVQFFVGIERDISERKKAEEQVRMALNNLQEKSQMLAEEKYRSDALIESIGDGIIVTNQDGVITIVNKSAENMLGFFQHELIGKSIVSTLVLLNKDLEEINIQLRPMVLSLSSGKKIATPVGETYHLKRKDGTTFPVNLTVTPFEWNGRIIGTVQVFRDITLEKEIDKAKTEFVSLASHQLRTPLTAINWYSEMLQNGDAGDLNEQQKQFISTISESSKRMSDLVNSLLNVSRIEMGTFIMEPEETDIISLAKSVLNELTPQTQEKKLNISTKFQEEKIMMNADPKLLRIVLQNLLSNSVKYTPEKGTINLQISKDEKNFTITVSDTGMGIPQNQQGMVYEKLFRADNVRQKNVEGTGLGLYLVKSIIDHSYGSINFESKENKGTIFYVTFPIAGMPRKEGSKALS